MTVRVEHADMLQAIPRLVAEGVVCDAVVTDPPYHLTATLSRFGKADAAPAQHGRDGAMARLSGGFMGQQWDGGDIAFRPETWATVATILRPGAFLVAFGGTRTYHRLACAIEDGGFVIQDCVMWLFATGFPKRRDMLKPAYEPIVLAYKPGGKRTMQINECRILPEGQQWDGEQSLCDSCAAAVESRGRRGTPGTEASTATSNAAQTLNARASSSQHDTGKTDIGCSGGTKAGDIYANLSTFAYGAKPLDQCQTATKSTTMTRTAATTSSITCSSCQKPITGDYMRRGNAAGRWPANCAHDGSDEVLAAFPDSAGQQGDIRGSEPSCLVAHSNGIYGKKKTAPFNRRVGEASAERRYTDDGASDFAMLPGVRRNDGGSAARFFMSAKAGRHDRWTAEKHELTVSWSSGTSQCQAVLLVATGLSPEKVIGASGSATAEEWNTFLFGSGLTELCRKATKSTIRMTTSSTTDLKTWRWLTRSLTSDFTPAVISSKGNGSSLAEDAASTSLSISFTLAATASLPSANRVLSGASFAISGRVKHGSHPTVKPVELMKWLVALVTPLSVDGRPGLVLDPFAGSGTTGVAALATGRNAILIEREATYHADILERMAHHEGDGRHSLASKARQARPRGETPLFDQPYNADADAIGSYHDAIAAVGGRVKAGEPVPAFFLSDKPEAAR